MSLGQARGSIVIDVKSVEDANKRVGQLSQAMTQSLNAIGLGTGIVLAKQLAQMTYELAATAAQANLTRQSFNTLAEGAGQNADKMLEAMRKASKGMIADSDLVLSANRAMLLGVASDSEQLGQLLDVARVRGQAMGLSLTKAFDDLVIGLARLSPMILDNLGIKGTQKALDDYADSIGVAKDSLTDAQRQVILFNAVMASTKPLIDASAGAVDDASTKFQQFEARLKNTKQEMGDFLLAAGATDALSNLSLGLEDNMIQLERLEAWLNKVKDALLAWPQFGLDTSKLDAFMDRLSATSNAIASFGVMIGTRGEASRFNSSSLQSSGSLGGASAAGGSSGPRAVPGMVFDPKPLIAAQVGYARDLGEINRQSGESIQDATEQYGRQRADTIRGYEQGIARDAEDFAQSRARSQRDYERSILEIMRDSQEREAKAQADLDERIGDAQEASNQRVQKINEDFARSQERAALDHRDKLLDAAGRLDAIAVRNEQNAYAKSQKEAQEDHDTQIKEEAESLAERIAQDKEAHQEQLQEAREADAKRLEDMRLARAQQQADEDADREKARIRAAEDHQAALDAAAAEHQRNLSQIATNAAEERAALQTAFEDELIALGLHNVAVEAERKRAQDAELKAQEPFMKAWFKSIQDAIAALPGPDPLNPMITPGGWPSLQPATPGSSATASTSTTTNSRSFVIQPGGVVVNVPVGTDMAQGKEMVMEALVDFFEGQA